MKGTDVSDGAMAAESGLHLGGSCLGQVGGRVVSRMDGHSWGLNLEHSSSVLLESHLAAARRIFHGETIALIFAEGTASYVDGALLH